MNLEWFDRVCGELQESLESICDKYDENGGMSIERGAKHPRIDFLSIVKILKESIFVPFILIREMKNSI